MRENNGELLILMLKDKMIAVFFQLRTQGNDEHNMAIELFDDQHRSLKEMIFPILFIADIDPKRTPPNFSFMNKFLESPLFDSLFSHIPPIKVFLHNREV